MCRGAAVIKTEMFRPEIRVTAQKGVSNHNRGSEMRRQIDTGREGKPCDKTQQQEDKNHGGRHPNKLITL